jgi:hypothetical protein
MKQPALPKCPAVLNIIHSQLETTLLYPSDPPGRHHRRKDTQKVARGNRQTYRGARERSKIGQGEHMVRTRLQITVSNGLRTSGVAIRVGFENHEVRARNRRLAKDFEAPSTPHAPSSTACFVLVGGQPAGGPGLSGFRRIRRQDHSHLRVKVAGTVVSTSIESEGHSPRSSTFCTGGEPSPIIISTQAAIENVPPLSANISNSVSV